jgi:hypothetical protein
MSQPTRIEVAFESPANAAVLRHLRERNPDWAARHKPSCPPEEVKDAYMSLGTHPELVARLWDQITAALPVRCAYVVYGSPVLVRPDTGILFGFAGGTHTYALRLPPAPRAEMASTALRQAEKNADKFALRGPARDKYLRAQAGDVHQYTGGSKLDISTLGNEWVFGRWMEDETRWCISAYEYAV